MRKKLVLSVMGILLILGTVTNVMFTRAEKSSDRTWLASIEALEALAEDELGGSPGGCGTAVYFYDCYGAQIAENDFTRSIPCQ